MEVACLLVPDFPIALARRDRPELRGKPVVVGGSAEEHARVTACSDEAATTGVAIGMPLRRALALCPRAVFIPLRQTELATEACRLTDLVCVSSPVVEEVDPRSRAHRNTGLARMLGMGEQAYLRELQQSACETTGLSVSLGAADAVFVAHAAAVVGAGGAAPVTVAPAETRGFLADLPIEALPVPPAMHQRLRLLGLVRLDDIADLSLSALQAQFGPDGRRAWELAHGRDASVIVPRRASVQVDAELDLPAPSALVEPLVVATRELLQRALQRPELQGHSLGQLDWRLTQEDGELITRRFVFRGPTRDAARMLFVVRSKAEQLKLTAPVVSVAVTLSGLCSEYGHQANLWSVGPRRQRELSEAIEQLNTREGSAQVYQIVEVQPWSRIPERQLAPIAYGG